MASTSPVAAGGAAVRARDGFQRRRVRAHGQRPRMQTRAAVVSLTKGDAVVFAVNSRPVRRTRGDYRVKLRHGVSKISTGTVTRSASSFMTRLVARARSAPTKATSSSASDRYQTPRPDCAGTTGVTTAPNRIAPLRASPSRAWQRSGEKFVRVTGQARQMMIQGENFSRCIRTTWQFLDWNINRRPLLKLLGDLFHGRSVSRSVRWYLDY